MNLGKISYWYGRLGVQANKIMIGTVYLITLYEMAVREPLAIFLLPLGLIGLAVLGYVDHRKAIEQELAYWFDRNPRFNEMKRDLEEVKLELRKQAHERKA